ncbi:MAG TPA: glutamate-1-semialdehyde 2,1-aminomutase [Candidatus Omnitrophota bacterium]|nr:glutamate-1-semialdehyde 2,1-aminomutase [Candidatus Omnitrophota bacterium]HQJ15054.1 glutamate-1-semialdehyde 2,1-aminomutase [Candidatus Omnitrophota bacterium]
MARANRNLHTRSRKFYAEAVQVLVGGVNSPVRACKAVGVDPVFMAQGAGSRIVDVDRNRYIDFCMSWGALILGHAHPAVVRAVKGASARGMSFGAPTENETVLAHALCDAVPSMQKVRFVNSGTEATMSAIRLARGFTGRDKILKFEGCYHGHTDSLLVKAGSGAATYGVPDSLGITAGTSRDTIVCAYNDIDAASRIIREGRSKIAAVIVEPVAANMGVILPEPGFLAALRELTRRHRVLLIFDEVISGFRFTYGGVQSLFGIEPDLTCLGKIIGAGMPLAAYGGRKEIMDYLSPLGKVYQAGTLSGNPVAVAAGLAGLKELKNRDYAQLNSDTAEMCQTMEDIFRRSRVPCTVNRAGSMFTFFFTNKRVRDYATAKSSDTKVYARFFKEMLAQGIYTAPSQFEANFFSFAHTGKDIRETVMACARAVRRL